MPESFGWLRVLEADALAVDQDGLPLVLYAWELPCGVVIRTHQNLNYGVRRLDVKRVEDAIRRGRESGETFRTLQADAGGHRLGSTSDAPDGGLLEFLRRKPDPEGG